MTHKGNFHVIPHGRGWDVRQEGALRARFHYETQEDAIKALLPSAKKWSCWCMVAMAKSASIVAPTTDR
ncbi:DUF2188 domain-containing protein [Cupriavidus sp. D39]|uniref:DUF2188 domain-containing protein n=1 Tax=Cupriavidus sp. D39 TaxID=2997877 RepID=UPI002D1E43E9|nr:DUF2188 domain-containing protein [Cupriavidus sp. D39]